MPPEFKIYEWIFEKGLSVGLVIYFVIWFTQKIDPKLTSLIDGISKLIARDDTRGEAFESVLRVKTQTLETVAKNEHRLEDIKQTLDKLHAMTEAIRIHLISQNK